jgi:hypothetical protein
MAMLKAKIMTASAQTIFRNIGAPFQRVQTRIYLILAHCQEEIATCSFSANAANCKKKATFSSFFNKPGPAGRKTAMRMKPVAKRKVPLPA